MMLTSKEHSGIGCSLSLALVLFFVAGCGAEPASPQPVFEQIPEEAPIVERTIGIQAGHGNGDAGAGFCPGATSIPGIKNEADLNLAVATTVEELLSGIDGYNIRLFVGKDTGMMGLKADAFVAIHADQGKPGVIGYKVSRFGGERGSGLDGSGDASDRLVQAIWDEYGNTTGLDRDKQAGHYTDNMLYYYALGWIDDSTPGAIIEMGWLCDDLGILLYERENVALGIAKSIMAFLGDDTAALPDRFAEQSSANAIEDESTIPPGGDTSSNRLEDASSTILDGEWLVVLNVNEAYDANGNWHQFDRGDWILQLDQLGNTIIGVSVDGSLCPTRLNGSIDSAGQMRLNLTFSQCCQGLSTEISANLDSENSFSGVHRPVSSIPEDCIGLWAEVIGTRR